jgi:hypothetical protein
MYARIGFTPSSPKTIQLSVDGFNFNINLQNISWKNW